MAKQPKMDGAWKQQGQDTALQNGGREKKGGERERERERETLAVQLSGLYLPALFTTVFTLGIGQTDYPPLFFFFFQV